MATAKKEIEEIVIDDGITTIAPEKEAERSEPMVDVFIPALEDSGSNGLKVDQYEHVTIANEQGEKCYKVRRGEHVEIPVSVYCILKARYPKI